MSVVEVIFEKLPIYNSKYTQTVVTIIDEVDSLLRPKKLETKWLSWTEEDTVVVMREGQFFLVDHKSGSHKHTYYQMLILGQAWENERYENKDIPVIVANAKIIVTEEYTWRKLMNVVQYLKKQNIELPKEKNLFYTTVKLWYLEKKTGLVRSLLAPKSSINYEKIYVEVLGNAKKLSLDYLVKLREEIEKIIKEKEEERINEVAVRL